MVDGAPTDVVCKTECSMIDGKMVSLLQGDSGAFCHLCHTTHASCKRTWDQLVSGDIVYTSSERQGQCHENIVQADLNCFSVLHFKLRSLDFAQKILY